MKTKVMSFWQIVSHIMNHPVRINLKYRLSSGIAAVIVLLFMAVCGGTAYYLTSVDNTARLKLDGRISFLENAAASSGTGRSTVELALAYYLNGDTPDAEGLLNHILKDNQNHGLANIYLGLIKADQREYRAAIPYLEKGIRLAPGQEPLAFGYLGQCYYHIGNLKQAAGFLQQACQVEPESPVNFYYLGLVQSRQGAVSQARVSLSKALKLAGNNYPEAQTALKQLVTR